MTAPDQTFETYVADRLLAEREALTRDWLRRVDASGLQPERARGNGGDAERDAEPLFRELVRFLQREEEDRLAEEPAVAGHLDGASVFPELQDDPAALLRALDELGQVLDGACLDWIERYPGEPDQGATLRVVGRLNRAPLLIGAACLSARADGKGLRRGWQIEDFADILAHELNSPLSAAEMSACLLVDDEVVECMQTRRRIAVMVQRNIRRTRSVISDVRALASARMAPPGGGRRAPVGMVLAEVLGELRSSVVDAGVRLEVEDPIPDVLVPAAPVRIILVNLINNATKYADPSRTVPWVRISFERKGEEERWWARVSDNGLGIPPEARERVFERFFRAHPERAGGSGLGLSIVADLVRQVDGRIELESEVGRGSTFCFTLPVAEPPLS